MECQFLLFERNMHVYLGSLFVSKAVGFDIVLEPMAKSYIYICL